MERIFLIGPPGAGKTACGQALADLLQCDFFDTDRLIESAQGCTVSEIFAKQGEAGFRALERALLVEMQGQPISVDLGAGGQPISVDFGAGGQPISVDVGAGGQAISVNLKHRGEPISVDSGHQEPQRGKITVFATGGGLPVYNNNIELLQQLGKVVALSADLAVLVERVKATGKRPLLALSGEDADKELQKRISDLLAERSPVYERAGYKIDTSGLSPEQVANEIVGILYGKRAFPLT